MSTIVIIGGGCWGTLHATRLWNARSRGRLAGSRLLVVDRLEAPAVQGQLGEREGLAYSQSDWDDFLDAYLDGPEAGPEDWIVPSPHAPHLLLAWMQRALARALGDRTVATVPVTHTFEQPYARHGADGAFYFSFADWVCPTECQEPKRCPAIRAPRDWEQAEFLKAFAAERPAISGLATFISRHLAGGIAAVPVAEVRAARDRFVALAQQRPEALTLLVATVSACHGALGQLELGARAGATSATPVS